MGIIVSVFGCKNSQRITQANNANAQCGLGNPPLVGADFVTPRTAVHDEPCDLLASFYSGKKLFFCRLEHCNFQHYAFTNTQFACALGLAKGPEAS